MVGVDSYGDSCLEREIQGLFAMAGRNDLDRVSYHRLLREALAAGLLTESEFAVFDAHRSVARNPYVHPRQGGDIALVRRAVALDEEFEKMYELDAEHSIVAFVRLLRRRPWRY